MNIGVDYYYYRLMNAKRDLSPEPPRKQKEKEKEKKSKREEEEVEEKEEAPAEDVAEIEGEEEETIIKRPTKARKGVIVDDEEDV